MTQSSQHRTRGRVPRLCAIIVCSLMSGMPGGNVLADEYPDYEACARVKDTSPPQADLPSKQLAASLARCDPADLYYTARGEPRAAPAQWANVRACAFATHDNPVLMMLYANGFGVTQNLDLALKYACLMGGAPAEIEGRIDHLTAMKESGGTGAKPFDQCDDVTSGYMMGRCQALSEQQAGKARRKRLAGLAGRLPPAQKTGFEKLQKAVNDFARARADDETDLSGTARAMFAIAAEAAEQDLFVSDLDQFEQGKLPAFTADQFAALDKTLNQTYRKLMQAMAQESASDFGTVTKDGVRDAQRTWLKYRDAWVAFGRLRYPSVPPHAWQALLTERRIRQLKELMGEGNEE